MVPLGRDVWRVSSISEHMLAISYDYEKILLVDKILEIVTKNISVNQGCL